MSVSADCPHAAQLPELRRPTLPADRRAELERHVAACPVCRRLVEPPSASQRTATDEAVPTTPFEGPPAGGSAASQPDVGRLLGPYLLLECVGEGGMGRVYRARHTVLDRLVALKVVLPDGRSRAVDRQRFLREGQAAARLEHPNVVRVHDANEADGMPYLAMEFVDGTDLARLLRAGRLPVRDALEYVRQAALGLQHLHEAGLVHRDIKPANLLLTRDRSRVKVSDLGLARLADPADPPDAPLTRAGSWMGTVDFMAPEQALDASRADIRADLYALGCTLYALLANRVPFPGGTAMEKIIRHREEEPPRVEALRPDVPRAVGALVRRLMAKPPADRIQTPGELAAVLADLLAARPRRRWPAAAAAIGLVAAAAAVGLAVILARPNPPSPVLDPEAPAASSAPATSPAPAAPASGGALPRDGEWRFEDAFRAIAFAPDGRVRFVGKRSIVYTAAPGQAGRPTEFPFAKDDWHGPFAFTPDGRRMATGRFWQWSPDERKSAGELATSGTADGQPFRLTAIDEMAYTSDNRHLIAAVRLTSNGTDERFGVVWWTADGRLAHAWRSPYTAPLSLAVAPDGETIALSTADRRVRVVAGKTGKLIWERPAPEAVDGLAFSPTGHRLAGGMEGQAILWDAARGDVKVTLPCGVTMKAVAFSPDGRWLAAGGYQLLVWQLDRLPRTPVELVEAHQYTIRSLAFSPDSRFLAAACEGNKAPACVLFRELPAAREP